MRMSFYLALQSDSSLGYFYNNKISNFFTHLPAQIDLTGEWEVGLVELIYPHTWFNITGDCNHFNYDSGSGRMKPFEIPVGYYESVSEVVKAMTTHFKSDKIYLYYNKNTRRMKMTLASGTKLNLYPGIAEVLGFEPGLLSAHSGNITTHGSFVADLNSAFSLLYVYSDTVEPQFVGDIHAPLLRIVKVTGHDGKTVSALYDRPHYLPLTRKNFQTVEIVESWVK